MPSLEFEDRHSVGLAVDFFFRDVATGKPVRVRCSDVLLEEVAHDYPEYSKERIANDRERVSKQLRLVVGMLRYHDEWPEDGFLSFDSAVTALVPRLPAVTEEEVAALVDGRPITI